MFKELHLVCLDDEICLYQVGNDTGKGYFLFSVKSGHSMSVVPLFQENKEDGKEEEYECNEVVPLKCLATKTCHGENGEDYQCYCLLDDLQLEKREWTAIFLESEMVGRNHETILHECQSPGDEYDDIQWGVAMQNVHVLQFQMSIPRKCHEDIGHDE